VREGRGERRDKSGVKSQEGNAGGDKGERVERQFIWRRYAAPGFPIGVENKKGSNLHS